MERIHIKYSILFSPSIFTHTSEKGSQINDLYEDFQSLLTISSTTPGEDIHLSNQSRRYQGVVIRGIRILYGTL